MIQIRKSKDRGHANHGWLESYHTFSFADYIDPKHRHFGHLRVINEDWVQPGEGFDEHPHEDMEIITYVLEGELEHKDSMGNGSIIRPGDVQRMSAGTGILHSEFNHSKKTTLHLLQIWIFPEEKGITPGYEQKNFPLSEKTNQLRLIVSKDGESGSIQIHQDAKIYCTLLDQGKSLAHPLDKDRKAWLQVASGEILLNQMELKSGDGAAISSESLLEIKALTKAEIIVFDLK